MNHEGPVATDEEQPAEVGRRSEIDGGLIANTSERRSKICGGMTADISNVGLRFVVERAFQRNRCVNSI